MVIAGITGCGSHSESKPVVPTDDESRVFMLVAGPSSEGCYERAIAVSDSLLRETVMSDSLKGYIMVERNVALFNSGHIVESMAYSDTIIQFSTDKGINNILAQTLQTKGAAHRRFEEYASAIDCYTRALDIAVNEQDIVMEQVLTDMLAIVYSETGRNAEAYEFADRSRILAEELADTTAIVSAVATLGAISIKENHNREVIAMLSKYLPMAYTTLPPIQIKFLTPLVNACIEADSLYRAGNLIKTMEKVVDGYPPTHQSCVATLTAKAKLLGKEKRFHDQWSVFQKIDTLGTHGKTADNIHIERAECLAGMGRYHEAFDRMKKAHAALDSIRHTAIEKELSDLSVRYDTLNKEIEIKRLGHQRRILVNIVLSIILLAGIIAALATWLRFRNLRKVAIEKHLAYIRGLEQERARIARELHDDVAGDLVGLQMEFAQCHADETESRIGEIARKVRSLSHDLMPPQFQSVPFTSMLLDFVNDRNRHRTTPKISVSDEGCFDWSSLSPEHSRELYRIVQETVTNILKHSRASFINITLDGDDGYFSLSVENDGVPAGSASDSSGIGLRTIKARAAIIGAEIKTEYNNNINKFQVRSISNT